MVVVGTLILSCSGDLIRTKRDSVVVLEGACCPGDLVYETFLFLVKRGGGCGRWAGVRSKRVFLFEFHNWVFKLAIPPPLPPNHTPLADNETRLGPARTLRTSLPSSRRPSRTSAPCCPTPPSGTPCSSRWSLSAYFR